MSNCPCGGVILADTENWKTPLCHACYTDLHEGYSAIVEKLRVAVEALENIARGDAQFDNVDHMYTARQTLAKIKGGGE